MNQYYQENKDKIAEYQKQRYQKNREKIAEKQKQYYNTPIGRAHRLVSAYNRKDSLYNRGKGNLTAQWIVDNILSKPCAHCGKEGWKIIGCNRLDDTLPHTKDNVEPCCFTCNRKLQGNPKEMVN